MTESVVNFFCHGSSLVGVLHNPQQPARRGIVMVMGGGPQYRVGGHRQLTLWARRLCEEGFAVFRFDYRGMGDSHGDFLGFEQVDDDIEAAIDQFQQQVPELEQIVLWGQCDAASAILFYAHRDARVAGAVLMNPWVRTEAGQAKAIIKYYYLERIMQPSFWRKVSRLQFNPVRSAASALALMMQSRSKAAKPALSGKREGSGRSLGAPLDRGLPLPDRMLEGLSRLHRPVMMILSGRDLVAREFEILVGESAAWKEQLDDERVKHYALPESDHTFSSASQRTQVIENSLQWLRGW